MRAVSKLGLAAVLAALCLGAPVHESRATSEIALTEALMVETSDWIASAEVTGSRSEWIERELWTRVDLAVSRTLKGPARERVTLMLLGGIDPATGIGSSIPGTPVLPIGAKLLVIGRKSPTVAGAFEPIALMQGIWIEPSAADGAVPDAPEIPLTSAGDPRDAAARQNDLAAVMARVQAILARERAAAAQARENR
jgi:hypothetical protein